MGTIAKALRLLTHFSVDLPEISLSRFVQLTGEDKATVHRRLRELRACGFLQQDPDSRAYRLGPAISRLEVVKESIFPAQRSTMNVIKELNATVGETVHVSVMQESQGLSTIAHIIDLTHGIQVHVSPNELLPYHATASGLICLAHMDKDRVESFFSEGLNQYTSDTVTDVDSLRNSLKTVRKLGYARSQGGFELDVVGIAVPVFNHRNRCAGAVAVAAPSSRMTTQHEQNILPALRDAARKIKIN